VRAAGWLALVLLPGLLGASALPPSVAEIQPGLQAAERRLQDASLAFEAARRESLPAVQAASLARAASGSWWGRWRLRRALAELKTRLDRVEAARAERAAAREQLFLLLTAAEEELRTSLEKALAGKGTAGQAAGLGAWWEQEQGWSSRLESLEAAPADATDAPHSGLMAQARVEQLERDTAILTQLSRKGLIPAAQVRQDDRQLKAMLARWRRAARPYKI
jgi:hypothetical protein